MACVDGGLKVFGEKARMFPVNNGSNLEGLWVDDDIELGVRERGEGAVNAVPSAVDGPGVERQVYREVWVWVDTLPERSCGTQHDEGAG